MGKQRNPNSRRTLARKHSESPSLDRNRSQRSSSGKRIRKETKDVRPRSKSQKRKIKRSSESRSPSFANRKKRKLTLRNKDFRSNVRSPSPKEQNGQRRDHHTAKDMGKTSKLMALMTEVKSEDASSDDAQLERRKKTDAHENASGKRRAPSKD